MAIIIHSL